MIDCPTPAQRELFGPKRRRVPEMMDLKNPILLGPVQNQEHHMNGVVARRNNFNEPILGMLKDAYAEVEDQEDEHLYHSRGWMRELELQMLGLKAVLPPPEERKHVKTAVSAARAEHQRGKMR